MPRPTPATAPSLRAITRASPEAPSGQPLGTRSTSDATSVGACIPHQADGLAAPIHATRARLQPSRAPPGALLLPSCEPRRRMPAPDDGGRLSGLRRRPLGRRAGASVGSFVHRRRWERAAPQGALPTMRATTHVDGKPTGSSHRARRGAGFWLRTTRPPPAGADIEQPDRVAASRRRPVVLSQGARARMGVPVGEGSAKPRSGRSGGGRPRARLPLPPAVAVVRTRPDGALACRPE